MIQSINAEFYQLRHRWMPRILFFIVVVIVALVMFGVGHSSHSGNVDFPHGLISSTLYAGFFAPILWPIMAGSMAGQDYAWGTIRLTLSLRPSRVEHALSGFMVAVFAIAAAMTGILIVGALMGWFLGATTTPPTVTGFHNGHFTHVPLPPVPIPSDFALIVVKTFFAQLYCVALYVLIAFVAGTIFRSTAAGVGIGLGSFIAGSIIFGIFYNLGNGHYYLHNIALKLPFAFTANLPNQMASPALVDSGAPSWALDVNQSLIGIAVYMGVLLALMLFVVAKRDVTS